MKKAIGIIVLCFLWCNTSYAGFGDKTIVLECASATSPQTFLKFKIFTHKEKGTRIKSYKLTENFLKLWDGELLANSEVDETGREFITGIKYFALDKPSIWAFGVSPVGTSQLNLIYYKNISAFESNLRDLRKKAFNTKYDRENQSKANDKHWEYVLAKEEVFNNIYNSNEKGNDVAFACKAK